MTHADSSSVKPSYQSVIAAAKLAARDILRARWITNLLSTRRDHEARVTELEGKFANHEKAVQVAQFTYDQAKANNDPRVEDFKKDLESVTKSSNEAIGRLQEQIDTEKKAIEKVNKEIADVESGELKVSYENLVSHTKTLIEKHYESAFLSGSYNA